MIGSANWIVTLGRMDIAYAVATLARYNMQPREGHLTAIRHVFGYLKRFPQGEILVDPSALKYDDMDLAPLDDKEIDWTEHYMYAKEEKPPDQPPPNSLKAQTTCMVDADHAHDQVTRRSVMGIIFYVNATPVKWISKQQGTVESSTYGSEMVANRR